VKNKGRMAFFTIAGMLFPSYNTIYFLYGVREKSTHILIAIIQ
jgi:hypothetical protein